MPITKSNHINIWYETFGDKKNESVLLIMGACCQAIFWPTEFCQQLAAQGFFVIRYDHRDTGLSSRVDYDKNPYDLVDMMNDAVSILDCLSIKKTHVFGLSMGGFIAQLLAVKYPERIYSIMLMATTCELRPMNLAFAGLPAEKGSLLPPSDIYLIWMKNFMSNPPHNKQENIKFRVECWHILSGDKVPFEEKRYYELHEEFIEREKGVSSYLNHLRVNTVSEALVRSLPSQVKVPTVILQGSEDPLFPPDHGRALTKLIPHATYLLVEGMGHVPNCHFYDLMIENISNKSSGFRAI